MNNVRYKADFRALYKNEDSWACWVGFIVIALSIPGIIGSTYGLPKVGAWQVNPLLSLSGDAVASYAIMFLGMAVLYLIALKIMGKKVNTYVGAFFVVSPRFHMRVFFLFSEIWVYIEHISACLAYEKIVPPVIVTPVTLPAVTSPKFAEIADR